jgi:carboxypeptidase PM20D1
MTIFRKVIGVTALSVSLLASVSACSGATEVPTAATPVTIALDEPAAAMRLADTVRIDTVSWGDGRATNGAGFQSLHDRLVTFYPRVHATLKSEVIGGYSLLYTWPGTDASLASILLSAHQDVVPVEPGTEGAWEHPAFSGDIADGLIWGRGTLDDKVMVVGMLEAVEHLLAEGVVPRRTVYLAFGHDEELDGHDGARQISELLAARGVHLEFVLDEGGLIALGDVTGAARPAALIGIAEKGYASIELTARGEGGHSSVPPADSAIALLAHAITRLDENPMPRALREPAAGMLDHLAPDLPFLERLAVNQRWLLEPLLIRQLGGTPSGNAMLRTTMVPTVISGGIKENVVPREARATVNLRILPGDTTEGAVAHVRSAIADPRVTVRLLEGTSVPSHISDPNAASFAALRTSVEQVFPGVIVAPSLVVAQTDSRHYAKLADNVYRFLPVPFNASDIPRFHGVNERIAVRAYGDVIRFYIQLLRNETR